MPLSFRVCRACSRDDCLELFASSLNFKLCSSCYCENNIMHQLDLHKVTKQKAIFFFFNLLRTTYFYSGTILTTTVALWSHIAGEKGASLQFLPALCGFGPDLVFTEGERWEDDTARPEFTLQCASAERPVVNRRQRGKTTGHQPERFGKRTSQGRFQLAQHVVTAVSHRGWEEEVGGSLKLREGEKRAGTHQDKHNWWQMKSCCMLHHSF